MHSEPNPFTETMISLAGEPEPENQSPTLEPELSIVGPWFSAECHGCASDSDVRKREIRIQQVNLGRVRATPSYEKRTVKPQFSDAIMAIRDEIALGKRK